ncbi:hypothetical protein ACTFR8_20125 [Bacillus cereus group sp. MYBK15-3]|uniref:hypothetical protein n=1 Tax=Bacillus cereus group TaxID=86661 RepID=UPI000C285AAA|nr:MULTISPECIES: hypothetical protein [Bacillus cereus group]USL07575.1 hypothetical protein LIT24_24390 [Bacillus bombysepticus]
MVIRYNFVCYYAVEKNVYKEIVHKIPFEKGSTVCFFTEPSASLFSGKSIVTLRRVPSSRLTSVIVLMKEYWQWRRYDYFNENASS